jgi:hypothetical protein
VVAPVRQHRVASTSPVRSGLQQRLLNLAQSAEKESIFQGLQHGTRTFKLTEIAGSLGEDNAHACRVNSEVMLFRLVDGLGECFIIVGCQGIRDGGSTKREIVGKIIACSMNSAGGHWPFSVNSMICEPAISLVRLPTLNWLKFPSR